MMTMINRRYNQFSIKNPHSARAALTVRENPFASNEAPITIAQQRSRPWQRHRITFHLSPHPGDMFMDRHRPGRSLSSSTSIFLHLLAFHHFRLDFVAVPIDFSFSTSFIAESLNKHVLLKRSGFYPKISGRKSECAKSPR